MVVGSTSSQPKELPFLMHFQEENTNTSLIKGIYNKELQVWVPILDISDTSKGIGTGTATMTDDGGDSDSDYHEV